MYLTITSPFTVTTLNRGAEEEAEPSSLTLGRRPFPLPGRWLNAVRGGASVAAEKKAAAGGKKKKAAKAAAAAPAAEAKVVKQPKPPAAPVEEEMGGVGTRTKTNKFIVDEAVNDDHSMVALSKETMQKLDIYQARFFGGGCCCGFDWSSLMLWW